MRANIQAVSLKIQALKAQNAMAQAMKGVTKAMMNMNKQMKLPEIQKIMQEFEKQSEIMDMKEEMMSDVIDDALGDEDDEEESDAIVTQVLQLNWWNKFYAFIVFIFSGPRWTGSAINRSNYRITSSIRYLFIRGIKYLTFKYFFRIAFSIHIVYPATQR